MTLKFNNIYINESAVVAGPYLYNGPLKGSFDACYSDFYDKEKTFEDCEIKELEKCINILLKKISLYNKDIDAMLSADLTNQLYISNFVAEKLKIPYIGIYNACASFTAELVLASSLLNNKDINNVICTTSGNNLTSERQFRSPIEYGSPKPDYSTFTVSAATACLLTKSKSSIKVVSGTIGKVYDLGVKDSFDMGSAMAPAAAETFYEHLINNDVDENYYDLIITGDLGVYGERIFKKYCNDLFNINLKNYYDSATKVYDMSNKKVLAGGSGPSCLPSYVFSYIIPKMKNKEIKRVLLLATGALLSTTSVNHKKSIPCICHAICLEAI